MKEPLLGMWTMPPRVLITDVLLKLRHVPCAEGQAHLTLRVDADDVPVVHDHRLYDLIVEPTATVDLQHRGGTLYGYISLTPHPLFLAYHDKEIPRRLRGLVPPAVGPAHLCR